MLDAGCGKGRHAQYLAQKGFDVTGIDLSFESISEAMKMGDTAPGGLPNLHFYQHDMRLLFWVNYFDYVFNFFTSFGYFHTRREHDDALRTLSAGLKPGGFMLFDYLNVHYSEENLVPHEMKTANGSTYEIHRWQDENYFFKKIIVQDAALSQKQEFTVSNMSSTKALKEITEKREGQYQPSAVGEVNVVKKMKEVNAVIGGEGNGGIIVPDFHYGRDALIGIGLFLSHFASFNKGMKSFRATYPDYFISKNKIELENGVDVKGLFEKIQKKYKNNPVNTEDGLKIEFDSDWVHLRTSNTEPIIRIYAESHFETTANNIAKRLMQDIRECSVSDNGR